MHPAIPTMLELQRVDHQIAALRAELDSYPKLIQQADAKLSGARAEVAAAKEAHAKSLAERKKFEADVQQWKDRAKKFRDQSGAVKTNEAYKALLHEIANAEAEVAKAEDRQLEVMMATEESERKVKLAESRLKDDEKVIAAERDRIAALNGKKKKEVEAATAERAKYLAPVPEDLRELYERIAKRHNGTALAEARTGQCRGCGMRILPHIYEDLRHERNEDIYRCETCGLILYSLEPLVPAAPAQNTSETPSTSS
jgi:predicted  nucleic acid-binding Zn-ribbon protein